MVPPTRPRSRPAGRTAWSSRTRGLDVLTGVGLAAMAMAAVNRMAGWERHPWLIGAQGVSRLLLLPAHPLLVLSLRRHRPRAAGAAALLAVAQLVLAGSGRSRRRADPVPPGATDVRVVTANLWLHNPDITAAGAELLADAPDLVVLQELTPQLLEGLRRSGLLAALPHHVLDPLPDHQGSAVLSRWPLTDTVVLDVDGSPMAAATVQTPAGPLLVVAVHLLNPAAPDARRRWQRQHRSLRLLVADAALPVVLAGDFNASADHVSFRRLLSGDVRDAMTVAARGAGATWPVWSGPVPPLMRLDHVLVPAAVGVRAARSEVTTGSDHRRLVVDLALAPGGHGRATTTDPTERPPRARRSGR